MCSRFYKKALCVPLVCLETALLEPKLREYTSRTAFALKKLRLVARAAGILFAHYFVLTARAAGILFAHYVVLVTYSRSCGIMLYLKLQPLSQVHGNALRVLLSCSNATTMFDPELRECSSRIACALETCDFSRSCRNALRVLNLYSKGAILAPEPVTARLRRQARKPRDNFQKPIRECKFARRHRESDPTRTIPAEGYVS